MFSDFRENMVTSEEKWNEWQKTTNKKWHSALYNKNTYNIHHKVQKHEASKRPWAQMEAWGQNLKW